MFRILKLKIRSLRLIRWKVVIVFRNMAPPLLKQTWIVMGVLMNMLGQGLLLSFSSILLPSIQDPDSDIKADLDTASTIASVVGTASIPTILLSSLLMDLYGRRLVHGIVAVPAIIGWLCIYYANSTTLLIIGRGLTGIATNASLGAIVIGEYCSPKSRGIFLNIKTTAVCLGYMAVHTLGHFYHWRTVALIALIPHTASLVITCTWPESPAWLVFMQRYEDSEESFYWLRGKSIETKNEIEDLIDAQKEKIPTTSTFSEKVIYFLKKFTQKDFIKPVIIILFSGILFEACGRHIFPAFAIQIVEEVTQSKAQSFYYTLGIDIIVTSSGIISSVLVKYLKRRTLLFGSGFSAVLFLYIVCGYLYLVNINILSNERTYIAIILFVVYFFLSNLGCTSIPLVLIGELFPLVHRGVGSSVAGIIFSILLILALKVTPFLLISAKVYGTFAILGVAMSISLVILWFILPETKDRTLQEVENYLNFGKYDRKVYDDVDRGRENYAFE